jgi:hypothetical protein
MPQLKGSTGMAELGVNLQASDGFSLDLAVQGYTGRREGVSGGVRFNYTF